MIAKISRGGRAAGLMAYLVSDGKRNEHKSPHLVAGSAGVMAWYSTDVLSPSDAYQLGTHLEAPNERFGTTVTKPVKEYDEETSELRATGERRSAHVWHCSLSLAPDHPQIDDDTWGDIASEFVKEMGFDDPDDPRAPCRWVAVHHGKSINGGDHIHLAVNLVREDGTRARTQDDFQRASKVLAKIERTERYGLQVLEGRGVGRSARADSLRELATVEAGDAAETPAARVARTVRASAAGSASEAEFVRRMRREGLWVKPRFQTGGQDVVMGFSVAERPPHGERAEWRAAGKLGRDLTLPRLREAWNQAEPTIAAAASLEAGEEWRAAWRGAPMVQPDAEPVSVDDATWNRCAEQVAAVNKHLTQLPVDDHAAWAQAAHEASGVLAAWSLRTEQTPGELAGASDMLARSAALHRRQAPALQQRVSMRGTTRTVMAIAAAGSGSKTAQAMVIRQLIVTATAFSRMAEKTRQTNQVAAWNASARRDLETVATEMSTGATITPKPDNSPARAVDPAMPNELKRAQERTNRGRGTRDFDR